MASYNKCMILGNLGTDPEEFITDSGVRICNFTVATNDGTKAKEKTNWHRIVCFGKTAENCMKYLKRGRPVLVEGQIDYTEDNKSGIKVIYTKIIANSVKFLGAVDQNKEPPKPTEPDFTFDDIPF